ncbi:SPOR domain-containing protein [Gemmatimonas aurantiaca]|nr:SPOR domain-containing protein [Gemmatimonas aurantiaca]
MTPAFSVASERTERLDEIEKLVSRGEIRKASDLLSELSQVSHRSPREMAIRARLEPAGARSIEFLLAANKVADNPRDRERIFLSQARYYQSGESWDSLAMVLRAYDREFKRGELRYEFARLQVFLFERRGELSSAQRLVAQMSRSVSNSDIREWASFMHARYQLSSATNVEKRQAKKQLARIAGANGSQMAPLALYLLSQGNIAVKDFDNAALNFSILREAYPDAIGADDLIDGISALASTGGDVERLIGSLYSVQVGVFSKKDNAKRQKKRFERYAKPVEIRRKNISGKYYFAVYVGEFRSAEDALAFKKTLELSEKELFSVILRDG